MTEVYHIPTGFMMIKRNVIEKMMKEYPETKYTNNMGSLTEEEGKLTYALFDWLYLKQITLICLKTGYFVNAGDKSVDKFSLMWELI